MLEPASVVGRVRSLVERASPRAREVLLAAVRRLAIHPRQRIPSWHYLELCPAYLRTHVDCCYETARQAWRSLRAAVGWWSVPIETARDMGVVPRRLVGGQRHGQHLLIAPDLSAAFQELAEDLGVATPTPNDRLAWVPVAPRVKGSGLVCCCPFHDDQHPSMLLDPHRRRATCLTCGTVHRFDGTRVSSRIEPQPRSAVPTPVLAPVASTTSYPPPAPGWVVGWLSAAGLRTCMHDGDLFQVLGEADERARRSVLPVMGGQRIRPRDTTPDLVAHLDPVIPLGWKETRGRWKPTGHRAISERYVLVDVDAIEIPNVLDARDGLELAAAGSEIEAWARAHPAFSGRVAVVATSLHGVQVTLELSEAQAPGWRRFTGADACTLAEAQVLAALERHQYLGGHVDPSARLGGRLLRRPGPRLDKRGQPWCARLRFLSTSEASCPKS